MLINKYKHLNFIDKSVFIFSLIISLLILAPIFVIIIGNFGPDLKYFNFFTNLEFVNYTKNSLFILFSVLFITFFLGTFSAYLVSFFDFPFVNFFKYSLLLSFAIPPYIFGYTLSGFFENYGTFFSITNFFFHKEISNQILPSIGPYLGSIMSLSLTLFGYVFILTRSSFINQSRNLIEVGKNLGFTNFDIFFKVILPSARPAVFIGLSLVGMETLADFGTVTFFGVSTFTTGIYNSWFIFDDLKTANFLSFLLLFFIFSFFIIESFFRRNMKFYNSFNSLRKKNEKITLKGTKKIFAFLFCFTLFFISFLFPLFQMFFWSFTFTNFFDLNEILKLNFNSLKLILLASTTIIFLSLFVNFGIRVLKSNFLNFFSNLSIAGYAIPGIVISVAVITFFSILDNLFNVNTKSFFIGSLSGLIFGYVIRFYSISFNTIKTVYLKINKTIDDSALLLGFDKFKILRKIHFPLLKSNFVFAFILISIEIIKELPITLILRPFNYETFSTKAFNMASNDLIEAAANPSLFIILWSSLFIVLSIKFFLIDKK